MEGLFIYVFFLIILAIALMKWNLSNLIKITDLETEITDLKIDIEELSFEFDRKFEENTKLKELLEIQNKLITDL